jgi:3-methyladenine DNA glycosylase/8-oxoguanine DNA glycosylase
MPTRTLRLTGPLDLGATLGALGLSVWPQATVRGSEAVSAMRTPDGPATVHLTVTGTTASAEAHGPGATWALDHVPAHLGVDDGIGDFRPPPGTVAELHRRLPGLRLGRTGLVYEALVPAVVGQRVTIEGARRSARLLVARFGEDAPGPFARRLLPAPEVLAGLDYADLHPIGIERKRAATLIEAARRARRLEEVMEMDVAAGWERLLALPGIGTWTAGHVMGIARGDRDAVPMGDFHLPDLVAWVLAGEARGDDARMLELLAPFRPQRRRVVLLVKRSGMKAPRHGPRRRTPRIDWW